LLKNGVRPNGNYALLRIAEHGFGLKKQICNYERKDGDSSFVASRLAFPHLHEDRAVDTRFSLLLVGGAKQPPP
jgi:hypothetical protein